MSFYCPVHGLVEPTTAGCPKCLFTGAATPVFRDPMYGQALRERDAARVEIARLRAEVERLGGKP